MWVRDSPSRLTAPGQRFGRPVVRTKTCAGAAAWHTTVMSADVLDRGPGPYEKAALLGDVLAATSQLSRPERTAFGLDSDAADGLGVGLVMRGTRAHLRRHGPSSSRPARLASWSDLNRSWRVMCLECARTPIDDVLPDTYSWSYEPLRLAKHLDNLRSIHLLVKDITDLGSLLTTCEEALACTARLDWDWAHRAGTSWFDQHAQRLVARSRARAAEIERGSGCLLFVRNYPLGAPLGRTASSVLTGVLGSNVTRVSPAAGANVTESLTHRLLFNDPHGITTRAWSFPDPGLDDAALEVFSSLCHDALVAGHEPSSELVAVAHSL